MSFCKQEPSHRPTALAPLAQWLGSPRHPQRVGSLGVPRTKRAVRLVARAPAIGAAVSRQFAQFSQWTEESLDVAQPTRNRAIVQYVLPRRLLETRSEAQRLLLN